MSGIVRNAIIAVGAIAIAILLIIAVFHPLAPRTSLPASLSWGNFTQLSDQSYGSTTNIYYVSWYGCPIGAADSWAVYVALSALGNMSTFAAPHYSDPADSPASLPGLIFSDGFTSNGVVLHSYYVYNEYLNISTNGIQLDKNNTVAVGLGELQSSLPSNIYSLEYSAMEKIPTAGMYGASYPAPSALRLNHINTNIIITGPHGAWILNGPLFNIGIISGLSSTQLMTGAYSNSVIVSAANVVSSVISNA